MSEEPTVSWKTYTDSQFMWLKELREEQRRGEEGKAVLRAEALRVALASILARLEGMNEFRLALTSQTATQATKENLAREVKAIDDKIADLTKLVTTLVGSMQGVDKSQDKGVKLWTVLIAGGGLLLGTVLGAVGVASGFYN